MSNFDYWFDDLSEGDLDRLLQALDERRNKNAQFGDHNETCCERSERLDLAEEWSDQTYSCHSCGAALHIDKSL